jgi:sialate O-acetylesterase
MKHSNPVTNPAWCMALVMCIVMPLHAAEPPSQPAAPPLTLAAQCGLPFGDNAVLQQQIPLPVWGTSLPGASVTVRIAEQTHRTTANEQGQWRIVLKPMTATRLTSVNQTPPSMAVTITCAKDGRKAVTRIENLVVGEVWLCAGQSNMAGKMRTNTTRHFPVDSIAKADYPAFRQMIALGDARWLVCSPKTATEFKKVCFFFGRRLQRDALVPVGVINAAVGGSNIESWLNQPPFETGGNYRKQIEPLIGFGLRGVIWYQGESNAKDGRAYLPKLRSLITGWRQVWQQPDSSDPTGPRGDFSFYFVQLPGIGVSPTDNPVQGDGRAEIRQAQCQALALPRTGMAITLDVGDVREHPPNKYDTGVRLARLALHHDYGFDKLVPTGPLYKSHRIVGSSVRISFDHAQNGLMIAQKQGFNPPTPAPDAKLGWLSVQGTDGQWHWATGTIDGSELVVTCQTVGKPLAVRYAYTNHPIGPLLYNRDGLPAGPFTTGGYDPPASPTP